MSVSRRSLVTKAMAMRSLHSTPRSLTLIFCALLMAAAAASAHDASEGSQDLATETSDWCATQKIFEKHVQITTNAAACPTFGDCDFPAVRNSFIPPADEPITTIRMIFHIVTRDDGSYASTTPQMIAQQVANLNNDYAPSRINFEYEYDYVHSTKYRSLGDAELDEMKAMSAVKPDSMLNVWVSFIEGGYSYGTFPWDPQCLTAYGGIVMTEGHFDVVQSTLAHEVGHCLGLWHTHHGVSEVSSCGACYERAGYTDGDVVGDLCEDTDPTPTNNRCAPPGGTDACSGNSWGTTHIQNYMGYSGESCWTEFSTQQKGRMHCWINGVLLGWTSGVRFVASNTLGPAPLPVTFTGISPKVVNSWSWDFGDGQSAGVQSPSHTYTQPGVFDVSLSIQSTSGPYQSLRRNLVWVYADTLRIDTTVGAPGQQVAVTISATNKVPLRSIIIPFSWDGPVELTLDSASIVGLRSSAMINSSFLNFDDYTRRAAFRLAVAEDQAYAELSPGSGPVLRLYFRVPSVTGATVPLNIISYSNVFASYAPQFQAVPGSFTPQTGNGALTTCLGGDINGNGFGPDLSDLSYLISYLIEGSALPNPAAANVDGLGIIDLSDLSYLIAYLIGGGPQPQCG